MAFTVEDGTGLANANSFVSTADADTYHADRKTSSEWAALATGDKQQLLVEATDFLNDNLTFPWKGTKNTDAQALAWPRSGVQERYGQPVEDNVVPLRVSNATAELALVLNTTELHPTIKFDTGNIRRKKVDVLETEYFSDRFVSHNPAAYTAIVTSVMGYLSPLLRDGGKDYLEAAPYFNLPDRSTTTTDTERPLFYDGMQDNQD